MTARSEDGGRLSRLAAAWVVARRDYTATLLSRTFIFFLLGPLFPVAVALMAQGIGQQARSHVGAPEIGLAMPAADADAMLSARNALAERIGGAIPPMIVLKRLAPGETYDAAKVLDNKDATLAAVVTGTLAEPHLTAPPGNLGRWQGVIGQIAAMAATSHPDVTPDVGTTPVATSGASQSRSRLTTANGALVMLFLLIMFLGGMVLSNLVEEKANKIIEILAAALPMDAVFMGKLFAMLGISITAIAVWGSVGGLVMWAGGSSLSDYADPAVGWPMFFLLGVIYFSTGYLLLGSIFLAIGSMATTVREVQTLSMPVTMSQVLIYFLATLAMTQQGKPIEFFAILFPLSSPLAMLARAAMDERLWPHLLAIGWQLLCVAIFVRAGSTLFRRKVMKSGPRGAKKSRGLFALIKAAFRNGSRQSA